MREVSRSALIGETPERMFELINDVPSYPQFVPWCTAARIEAQSANEIVATLVVRRGPLSLDFTTRNRLTPSSRIDMQLQKGPFRTLQGQWLLHPVADAGCRIELRLRFEFANRISAIVFDPLFEQTAAALVDAFVTRARVLRGAARLP